MIVWWIMGIALAVLILLIVLYRYYAKASLDIALVRTGLGGRRVVVDGGCLALPILHHLQKVSMQTVSFTITKTEKDSVLTQDKLRINLVMRLEFRVIPDENSVTLAAQAFGNRLSRGGDAVSDLMFGSVADAIQSATAKRTMDDVHFDRPGFTADVDKRVSEKSSLLGLEVVSCSLLQLDQSDLMQQNENNAFTSAGMRRLSELIAKEKKARVAIETEAESRVRELQLEQHRRKLELKREERETEIELNEHLSKLEAQANSREEQARDEAKLISETTRISSQKKTKTAEIESDEFLRKSEMSAILRLEKEKIFNEMQLSKVKTEEAQAKTEEEESRAKVILASEHVQTQREQAVAEREKLLAKLRQSKDLELEETKLKKNLEFDLARSDSNAKITKQSSEADLAKIEAEAAGLTAFNKAENSVSDAVIRMRLEELRLKQMPEIMAQMMKPVEKIDSIRINQISGMGDSLGSGSKSSDGALGSAMEQILAMAVRLPAMKQMGEEIGLDFDTYTAGRTADYANRIKNNEKDIEKEKK